ncbi:CDP-alcohol phosphatidyltransferase family protein [Marinobacter lacisalsi]|uniref:CDP-alcohol phosphatidyltransferase family protein n=1 Tax=Marinobacter lacisalsi TaxID=475979 RepID=A0ABV8QLD7_9GAMM
MDSSLRDNALARAPWRDLLLAGLGLATLLALTGSMLDLPAVSVAVAGLLYASLALLLITGLALSGSCFGPADRVTLGRAVLVLFLTSLTVQPGLLQQHAWPYALLCLTALLMDGADGYVARRTGTASPFGARFDMELDAFFILMLCLAVMVLGKAGPWVLLIGLMRYGFVMAGWCWKWLSHPLPESFRRKTVCVWQLVTLMVALLPPTPGLLARSSLIIALILLSWSFAIDSRYLYQQTRQGAHDGHSTEDS